jgi:hypothetical protein
VNFDEYLHSKKIDAAALQKSELAEYDRLQVIFDQVHPDSFTRQKLYLINPLRRKYKWEEKKVETASPEKTPAPNLSKPRPKFNKPKI